MNQEIDYLAMYLYRRLMEKKGWSLAPFFHELDEDEQQDWKIIAETTKEITPCA